MKKILTLLVLCVLNIVPMLAVVYYCPAGQSAIREYPSQEFKADTEFLLGNPRGDDFDKTLNGGRTYLSPKGMSVVATASSIYTFVATGAKDEQGTPTYLIKNKQTGEYLSDEKNLTAYTKSAAHAQAFTVMEADVRQAYYDEENKKWLYDWAGADYDVRTATLDIDTNGHYPLDVNFVTGQEKCYVICMAGTVKKKADGTQSATFINSCSTGNVQTWQDSNCWVLFTPAVEKGEKALADAYRDLLGEKEFNAEDYPIGTGPSLYPEEKVTAAIDAWELFIEYLNFGGGSDEDYEAAINNLEKALKELNESMGAMIDGQYYRFWNARNNGSASSPYEFHGCMYDDGTKLRWTPEYEKPGEIDLEASKYVFQLIVKDGKNYFQNYYTKRYMSDVNNKNDALPTTVDPVTNWRIEDASDLIPGSFRLRGNQSNEKELWSANVNPKTFNVGYWQSKTDKGSVWKVETIDSEQLRVLDEQIAKQKLLSDTKELLLKAQDSYDKGFVYDQYLKSIDQVAFNATEASEGSEAAFCDGDPSNYYHSRYSEDGDLGQPHWFQVTMETPLQDFAMDVYRRQLNGNANGRITRWFIAGTDNASLAESDDYVSGDMNATFEQYKKTWDTWTVVDGNYNKSVMFKGTQYKDAMATFDVTLQKPCKYIRCMAVMRQSDKILYDTISVDPLELQEIGIEYNSSNVPKNNVYMHMGEVVMRSKEINPELSIINGVPEEVRQALVEAMAKANEEVAAKEVSEETYEALVSAYNEFLLNYPDPEGLRKAVADAKTLIENIPTGDEPGYFPEGATDELNRVIEQVESTIKDVMSASDVNAGKEELSGAIDALMAKVILPEEGVYFLRNIQTTAEGVENERYVGSFRTGENTMRWGDNAVYACEDSPCYYWKLTKNDDGTFSLYSYATNNYLYGNVEKRGIDVTAGPVQANLQLRPARLGQEFVPGHFNIMLSDNFCLNVESTGRMVTWTPDANGAIAFVEPTDDWSGDYTIVYEAMVPQIITLPYDLTNDCISPLLKLVGTYNGAFQFEEYADDEVIPAGTPVLYYSEDKDFVTDAFALTTDDLEELTYTTEAKVQNGMVGVLTAVKELPVGSGIFFSNKIIGSVEGEGVDANTGYFLTDATTDHEGTLSIPYDSTVKSLEEGIQNALVINNKAGRGTFNLMGQKVQGKLPAGLYIVNGKKYIVK